MEVMIHKVSSLLEHSAARKTISKYSFNKKLGEL
jgi:hypothetical protein